MRTFSVLLDLGLLAGLLLAYLLWRQRGLAGERFVDGAVIILLGAVLGGRLAYLGLNSGYYLSHLGETWQIWRGGISFHGAFFGGALAAAWVARRARCSLRQWGDILALTLLLGSFFGWLACLAGGCAYGRVGQGSLFWLSPDIYGIEVPRFPTQVAGALQSLVLLGALLALWRRGSRPGLVLSFYLMLYFGGQFGLEFLRGDEVVMVGVWRLTQLIDVALFITGVALSLLARWRAADLNDDCPTSDHTPATAL